MTENDHDLLSYSGQNGEPVVVSVVAQDTTSLVTYNLKGAGVVPLPPGQSIQFPLGAGLNTLQLLMDSNTGNGSYRVVVRTVQNETNQECVHVWNYHGNLLIKDFVFFA